MSLFESIENMLAEGIDPETHTDEFWQKFGHRYAPLVIDSSGFTRITEAKGPLHYLTRLAQIRQLTQPILKSFSARIYSFEADNVLAYFDEVDQAVSAAIAIHHAIKEVGITLGDHEPYRICAGIGYGDLLFSETSEGCFGHEMNLASKLGEDVADPNELLMTPSALQHCNLPLQGLTSQRQMELSGVSATYYHLSMNDLEALDET